MVKLKLEKGREKRKEKRGKICKYVNRKTRALIIGSGKYAYSAYIIQQGRTKTFQRKINYALCAYRIQVEQNYIKTEHFTPQMI